MRCLSPQRQFSASNSANHWSRWQRATAFLPCMVIASTSQPGGLICCTSSILEAARAPEHIRDRVARKLPLKIVAIGSSSTAGAGVSSSGATYPSRLEAELKERLPGLPVTVLNKGIGGEEAAQMVARFDADVIEESPDLAVAGRQQLGAARLSDGGRSDPPGC